MLLESLQKLLLDGFYLNVGCYLYLKLPDKSLNYKQHKDIFGSSIEI